ncbi:MAG: hypothetical protein ACRDDM_07965 [Paraclostridium sp.]
MINNVNKNTYNTNLYKKPNIKLTNEAKILPNKIQNKEAKNFLIKIKEELKNIELIAIKIIKGEKLTSKEQRLITEKYPDIKQFAEQSKKETQELKERLKNCGTDEERKQIISSAINDIKIMGKKGVLSELQVKIKISSIEEIEKFSKQINIETKKAEIIATKIIKGEKLTPSEQKFITEKYPEIKQEAEQLIKENKDLKLQLKSCKTNEERQQMISKSINDLDIMFEKGTLSSTQFRLKILAIENLKKENENKLFSLNPYIYIIQSALSQNLTGILITIAIIIVALYIV